MNNDEIVAATVRITKNAKGEGGQGVLIPGAMIITAAHCVSWSCAGGMAKGDAYFDDNIYLETIQTNDGRKFRAVPMMVEPVSDIAILENAPPRFRDDVELFDAFCKTTRPVELSTIQPQLQTTFPIRIWSHVGEWIEGFGKFEHERRFKVTIDPKKAIPSGTSGGPVVDDNGDLLGVVSYSSDMSLEGMIPFASRALPVWVLDWISGKTQKAQLEFMQKAIALRSLAIKQVKKRGEGPSRARGCKRRGKPSSR